MVYELKVLGGRRSILFRLKTVNTLQPRLKNIG